MCDGRGATLGEATVVCNAGAINSKDAIIDEAIDVFLEPIIGSGHCLEFLGPLDSPALAHKPIQLIPPHIRVKIYGNFSVDIERHEYETSQPYYF